MEIIVVHDREEVDPTLARPVRVGPRASSPMVNTRTGGLCGARNTGVLASRGDFVASCDDDDLWYPAKVRLQVERLLADPDLLAVGAGIRLLMGDRGNVDVAGPRGRHQPRAAAGEPGQGAAQLDADDAPLRLRRGGPVRRGACRTATARTTTGCCGRAGWARSARSRRSWPTSARTSPPGSGTARSTPPRRWSTCSTSTPTSGTGAAVTPGSWARSPTQRAAAGERARGARIAGRALCRYPAPPHAWLALAVAGPGDRAAADAGGGAPPRTGALVSRLPNFLYVGPDKAGSSWLHEVLIKHPDVYLTPAKDLYFFDRYYDRGLAWYAAQFRDARDEKIVGEVCQDYLFHPEAAARIHETLGPVRVMVSLRDPVERAWSSYLYMRKHGIGPDTFAEALRSRPELLEHGRYATGLDRFLAALPARDHPRRALRRPDPGPAGASWTP